MDGNVLRFRSRARYRAGKLAGNPMIITPLNPNKTEYSHSEILNHLLILKFFFTISNFLTEKHKRVVFCNFFQTE